MKSKPRWFYYILLNIIVSAVVTLTVLYFYDNYRGTQVSSPIIATLPSQVSQSVPVDLSQVDLEIISVIGSGLVVTEVVVIQSKGDEAVTLTNWALINGSRTIFTFPQVKMFKDGMLQVHSAAGANTAVDLYLGRTEPAWQSGDVASIDDTQGNLVTTYLIP